MVLGVTLLISSSLILFSGTSRRQTALTVEAAKISQFILRAKALAVSTYDQANPPCGYGVRIDYDAGRYSMFSYAPPSCKGIVNIDTDFADQVPGASSFVVDRGLVFEENADSIAEVFFLAPTPKTFISFAVGGDLETNPGKIYLKTSAESANIIISVKYAGQVTI